MRRKINCCSQLMLSEEAEVPERPCTQALIRGMCLRFSLVTLMHCSVLQYILAVNNTMCYEFQNKLLGTLHLTSIKKKWNLENFYFHHTWTDATFLLRCRGVRSGAQPWDTGADQFTAWSWSWSWSTRSGSPWDPGSPLALLPCPKSNSSPILLFSWLSMYSESWQCLLHFKFAQIALSCGFLSSFF